MCVFLYRCVTVRLCSACSTCAGGEAQRTISRIHIRRDSACRIGVASPLCTLRQRAGSREANSLDLCLVTHKPIRYDTADLPHAQWLHMQAVLCRCLLSD